MWVARYYVTSEHTAKLSRNDALNVNYLHIQKINVNVNQHRMEAKVNSNVVYLPRPPNARSIPRPLALFVRVGHNDHREMLDLIPTVDGAPGGLGSVGFHCISAFAAGCT